MSKGSFQKPAGADCLETWNNEAIKGLGKNTVNLHSIGKKMACGMQKPTSDNRFSDSWSPASVRGMTGIEKL